jgi:predicted DNA-binding transcriptional regulator AlpA
MSTGSIYMAKGALAMEDRLMTIKQIAEYLSVNDRTVLKLVSDGALPERSGINGAFGRR